MAGSDRFTKMSDDMAQRRERAMQRSADLQSEVNNAVNALRGSRLSEQDAQRLIDRFSDMETLAAVSQDVIQDLIEGFQNYRESYIQKAGSQASDIVGSASAAIDNLNRIIGAKQNEIKGYELQKKKTR